MEIASKMQRNLKVHVSGIETPQETSSTEKTLASMIGVIAVIYPMTSIPQLWKIWVNQNVAGVSILMWVGFLVFSIPLFLYCVIRKENKMAMLYGAWMLIYVAVISGVVINA